MTGQEMISSFGLNYASEINSSVPGFEDGEILAFLNQAQDDIITLLCVSKTYDKVEVLRNKKSITILSPDPYTSNMVKGNLDFNYYWIITCRAKVTRSSLPSCSNQWFGTRDFNGRTEFISKYTVTGNNMPVYEEPIWYKDGEYIAMLADYYSVINAMLVEYIRIPTTIIDNADENELDVSIHSKIVDRAVTLALETLGNPRVQTQPQISQ